MKTCLFGLCVLAAACSGAGLDSPASPSSAAALAGVAQVGSAAREAQSRGGTELPFQGSYTMSSHCTVNCPPTIPPDTFQVQAEGNGTATHLGRFTLAATDNIVILSARSTGTWVLTAANGDQIFATTAGGEVPNEGVVRLQATITGGTGRFAGASGTFAVEFSQEIDFVAGTATGAGSFEGHLNLAK